MKIVAVLKLLIIRYTAERKDIFHIHNLITDSNIKFVHEINLSHEFDEFKGHQQPDLIKKILNENCFESFIIKVVMLDNNVQKFSIIFLKMMIFLLAGLQFKLSFHD